MIFAGHITLVQLGMIVLGVQGEFIQWTFKIIVHHTLLYCVLFLHLFFLFSILQLLNCLWKRFLLVFSIRI